MKVAFIIQDLFGRGAEYATALLARGFAAKGYEVDLIVSKVHDDKVAAGMSPFEVPPSVRMIHLKSRKARYNVLELRHYLKTTDAEVVIVMGGGYELMVPLASLGLTRKPRLYLVRHTIDFALDENNQYKPDAHPSLFSRVKLFLHYYKYDGILCVAERVRQEMIKRCKLDPQKVHTVYNPSIDETFFDKRSRKPTHPWLVNRDSPTFVAAGALQPEKNHFQIMEAIRRINNEYPVRLIVFGKGDMRAEYEHYISENNLGSVISLPGFSNVLPAEIAAATGYISSSVIESFGIAIVEGLASGVPIISTDSPCGPREILCDGKYGALVKMGDVDGMIQAMKDVLNGKINSAPEEAWKRFECSGIVSLYERMTGLC